MRLLPFSPNSKFNGLKHLKSYFHWHGGNPAIHLLKVLIGPLAALLIYSFIDLDPGKPEMTRMLAIGAWMALWWVFEAVPVAVTALLPFILFPFTGIMSSRDVAPFYMNQIIFLFIGGFIIAISMEKWNLHKRIALRIILTVGNSTERILFSFMFASYFLSMWISNTATVMMILPTILAVIYEIKKYSGSGTKLPIILLLGVAYASSIGGTATLIGTPPNLIFLSNYNEFFPEGTSITFAKWFLFGFPMSFALLIIAFFILRFSLRRGKGSKFDLDTSVLKEEQISLGPVRFEEKVILVIFTLTALLWFTRADLEIGSLVLSGWNKIVPNSEFFTDATVAIVMAIILFIIPSRSKEGKMLMDTEALKSVPFGVILLFGGGFALAEGFMSTGLSQWLAGQLIIFKGFSPFLLVLIITTFMNFFTEISSNTASAQIFLPILMVLSQSLGIHPLLLMIPVTFAASFAFMLPVATPVNIIVYGSNMLTVKDMVRHGLILNIIGSVLVTIAMFLFGKLIFGIQ